MVDIKLLKAKMALKGDFLLGDLANAMDITRTGLSLKIKQKNDFKQSEIDFIAKRYELTPDEIKQIFFS